MMAEEIAASSNPEKDSKKAAKQAAKDARKAEKEARKAKAADAVKRTAVLVEDFEKAQYGDLKMIQSEFRSKREWAAVRKQSASTVGSKIWLRCRLETIRATGKRCFVVLRQTPYTIQAVICEDAETPREMVKYISKIPVESIVDVFGMVHNAESPVASTSQSDVEILIAKLFVISASSPVLAMQIADANRPITDDTDDKTASASDAMATVGRAVRLDNRWLDLRAVANHAIFLLQSAVGTYFREYFLGRDFVEVHTPKLISAASEGGADVFKLDYFGNPAFLAQSPQLYKQMCINGDLHGVFEIGPVFRSERSFTHRHMCEFTGLDFEMEIKEHYHEVLETLGKLFKSIFDRLHDKHADELAVIRAQYPFDLLQYPDTPLVIHFADAIKLLREAGDTEADEFTDISTPQEKHLGTLVKKKYGTDFYIVDRYPMSARPFYTMPCPDDPRFSNSYDAFLRGEEITSGAQRIHDPDLLQRRAQELGVPVSTIQSYVDSFKSGAYPHGGAGIGLERVVMLFCGLKNIRLTSLFPRDPLRCTP